MNTFEEIGWLGKYLGSRLDLTQAGGGNISIKDGDKLVIKSSGCILSEVSESSGYSVVDKNKLNDKLISLKNIDESEFGQMLENIVEEGHKRPSIETPMHGIMKNRVVIHVHPISILALCSQKSSQSQVESLFGNSVWVDYATPGKKLAVGFQSSYGLKPDSDIVFLENHGIVIGADSAQQGVVKLEGIISQVEKYLNMDFKEEKKVTRIQELYFNAYKQMQSVYLVENRRLLESFRKLGNGIDIICPDDVVYIGLESLVSENLLLEEFILFEKDNGGRPVVIIEGDDVYIVGSNTIKCRQIYEQLFSNVIARVNIKEMKRIDEKEVHFLSNWEVEKYRQKLKG